MLHRATPLDVPPVATRLLSEPPAGDRPPPRRRLVGRHARRASSRPTGARCRSRSTGTGSATSSRRASTSARARWPSSAEAGASPSAQGRGSGTVPDAPPPSTPDAGLAHPRPGVQHHERSSASSRVPPPWRCSPAPRPPARSSTARPSSPPPSRGSSRSARAAARSIAPDRVMTAAHCVAGAPVESLGGVVSADGRHAPVHRRRAAPDLAPAQRPGELPRRHRHRAAGRAGRPGVAPVTLGGASPPAQATILGMGRPSPRAPARAPRPSSTRRCATLRCA